MNQIVKTEPRDYHEVILKVASVKDIDVDKLERLMKIQEEWEKRQAATHYNNQMSLAQGAMTRISKDSANPNTRSRYASLEALDEAIRPIYTQYGFSISFDDATPDDRSDGWLQLFAYVSNGAETRRFKKWVPVTTKGLHGKEALTPTHASIAAVTYARRALHKMIWNLAEEDTDGNFPRDEQVTKDEEPSLTADQIIEGMRACKDHTALYAYGLANRQKSYLKLGPDNRKLVDDIYKQLMDEFAEQQK